MDATSERRRKKGEDEAEKGDGKKKTKPTLPVEKNDRERGERGRGVLDNTNCIVITILIFLILSQE